MLSAGCKTHQKTILLFPLATFLKTFDISTVYPLLMFLAESKLTNGDWKQVSQFWNPTYCVELSAI